MRFIKIELINYIGIYNGLGLNSIEIDFTRCKFNKIIIRGDNGSGKSTLMKSLSVLHDSNDSFIPNMEARKSVIVEDAGTLYKINYIHSVTSSGGRSTAKGYIFKMVDGQYVLLNENGNLTACKEIIYSEFGLDSNYISLSKLSSEDRGLVDKKPAERKKFVVDIMGSLDTFNGIYKTLSNKLKYYKDLIKSIVYKIDKLGDPVVLNNRLVAIDDLIAKSEETKNLNVGNNAILSVKIEEMVTTLRDANYDDIVTALKTVSDLIKSLTSRFERVLVQCAVRSEDIDSEISKVEATLADKKNKLMAAKEIIPNLITEQEQYTEQLRDKNAKLDSLEITDTYSELRDMKSKLTAELNMHLELMKAAGIDPTSITDTEYESIIRTLAMIRELMIDLNKHSTVSINKACKYFGIYESATKVYSKVYDEIRITYAREQASIRDRINELTVKLMTAKSARESLSLLNDRPRDCKIDTCPFVASAIKTDRMYPNALIDSLNQEVSELVCKEKQLDSIIIENEEYVDILSLYKGIENLIIPNSAILSKIFDTKAFLHVLMYEYDPNESLDRLSTYLDLANITHQYSITTSNMNMVDEKLAQYNGREELINSIFDSINTLNTSLTYIEAKLGDYQNNVLQYTTEISLLEDRLSLLVTAADLKAQLEQAKSDKMALAEKEGMFSKVSETLREYQEKQLQCQTTIAELDTTIKNLSEERSTINRYLVLINEYNSEIAEYKAAYEKINVIKKYASPTEGIQIMFVQMYMNNIIATTNELLSYFFGGEFILQPFVLSESEFRIPCLGSGMLRDDISYMSTAQKGMISMILSFALLHQSSSKYNILFLDECDGGLDTNNRAGFVEVLDRLMIMMNVEQAFIISHNNELDTSMADIIVLKNESNTPYSGNIIWSF